MVIVSKWRTYVGRLDVDNSDNQQQNSKRQRVCMMDWIRMRIDALFDILFGFMFVFTINTYVYTLQEQNSPSTHTRVPTRHWNEITHLE